MIYVISKNGQPLMPTSRYGKIKHLLKDGKAKVIKRCPFTVKLLYDSNNYTQDLTLGVSTGSNTLSTAVSDSKGNIVYVSEVTVRNDISNKMTRRASYRRNRRNRKTRYRKPRWLYRKNSIKTDRFSPTMTSKLHSHVKEIEHIKTILPITLLVLETGKFDMHLMKNPKLADPRIRHWGYQKGINYGYENTKAMVLNRDDYTCKYCKGKHKDSKLEVHHIIFRSNDGSDEPDNLITLCHTCHKALHDGKINPKLQGKTKGTLKYATQMNSIRIQLLKTYPNAINTFGYVTKANRQSMGYAQKHYIDACVIAVGTNLVKLKTNLLYIKKSVSKGDYRQSKGIRSEQRIPTGKICGFRKFDKVLYMGKEYFIKGRESKGYAVLMDIYGNKADFGNMPKSFKTPKLSNCYRITARNSVMTSQMPIHLTV